jgi:hypothetical protein
MMADNRAILRTLIQSATVELFQYYGIAVAPMPVMQPLPTKLEQHVGGYGTFTGKGCNGTLGLLVPKEVFALTKFEGLRVLNILDWTKELTNQLLGRIKNRLVQYQMPIRGDIPSAIDGKSLELRVAASNPFVIVCFRSIRGEIIVTLTGSIDYSRLQFSGNVASAEEGDIILF